MITRLRTSLPGTLKMLALGSLAALAFSATLAATPAQAQGTGYWSTSGNRIVDSTGKQVRISGVNWYGFETTTKVPHGLYSQDYHSILNTIHSLGYNTIRLPFSNDMVENPVVSSNTGYSNGSGAINSDLQGLNSLQVMDKIIAAAGATGLKVILDNHRSEAGNSAEGNGLWYTNAYPESNWIADWQTLVRRYSSYTDSSGNPTVIGLDLRNEPHNATSGGACWTGDSSASGCPTSNSAHNWPAAAERAASAVQSINSRLLIFVEGTDEYNNDYGWWGGNLEGARANPVQLNTPGKLVYSAHDYGPHEYGQQWFNSSTTSTSLQAVWTKYWAYLSLDGTAPVWLGEFGTTNADSDIQNNAQGSQGQWFSSLVSFLGNNPNLSWTYWALNGEDSYGLLDGNYDSTPASAQKQQLLASIQSGQGTPTSTSCSITPAAPASASAKASSASQIGLTWTAVQSPTNCSATYSVFRSTASAFTPGSGNQVASGLTAPGFNDSGLNASTTYYYAVRAIDAHGSSASATASAQTAAATSSGSAGCHVAYAITNQWSGGFQASVSISNTGSTPVNGWILKWSFANDQKVSNLWNANWAQSGATVSASSLSYNATIPAHGNYTGVGFTGSASQANAIPTSFTLNGAACQ
jgi:endoglucanase